MRQRAHSTRSIGTGSGDRAFAVHAIVDSVAIARIRTVHRVVMSISPHVALEHALVPAQLEAARRVRLDSAIAEQDDPRSQVPDVRGHVRREQQTPAGALQLTGAL